jgi:signal transduction histidine kinase
LASNDSVDKQSNDYLNQQMDDIELLTQSLSSTIDDFRTLYKPDKVMHYDHINNPVERAIKLIHISLEKNSVSLKKLYHSDASVQMHANEIMQVVLNLLKNAEDNFIEKETVGPSISIETREEAAYLVIDICDNGGGIETSLMEKIFDPYFSTKDDKNGTGLGLYMSKIIVEQHHKGRLDVYNNDEGACFSIQLPKE